MPKRVYIVIIAILLLLAGGGMFVRHEYLAYLGPVSNDSVTQVITIKPGSSVRQIATQLESVHLIRSAVAFRWYVYSAGLSSKLQAGTYALAPNQKVSAIVETLTQGKVQTRLVTIIPGRRLDQIRANFINDGFSPASVDAALDPAQYADLPVMKFKPPGVTTLEGLLYPDSFQKDTTTAPSDIIRQSLIEMGDKLTPDLQAAITAQGLTTYQGIILASMVEQEVSKPSDRVQVAQVFLRRLRSNMPLGSDVTVFYAQTMARLNPGETFDAWDTTAHPGLPPTPISLVSENTLQAVAHPAGTNWLYFVTGDDGTTYFSQTLDEHNAQVQKYCHKLCPAN